MFDLLYVDHSDWNVTSLNLRFYKHGCKYSREISIWQSQKLCPPPIEIKWTLSFYHKKLIMIYMGCTVRYSNETEHLFLWQLLQALFRERVTVAGGFWVRFRWSVGSRVEVKNLECVGNICYQLSRAGARVVQPLKLPLSSFLESVYDCV